MGHITLIQMSRHTLSVPVHCHTHKSATSYTVCTCASDLKARGAKCSIMMCLSFKFRRYMRVAVCVAVHVGVCVAVCVAVRVVVARNVQL